MTELRATIPHRAPFLFVGEIVRSGPPEVVVWARFDPKNPYVGQDLVPRPLLVEAMAQAVGLHAADRLGPGQLGVLAMIRDVGFDGDVQGRDRVLLRATFQRTWGKVLWYRAVATRVEADGGERSVSSAEIVVAYSSSTNSSDTHRSSSQSPTHG